MGTLDELQGGLINNQVINLCISRNDPSGAVLEHPFSKVLVR